MKVEEFSRHVCKLKRDERIEAYRLLHVCTFLLRIPSAPFFPAFELLVIWRNTGGMRLSYAFSALRKDKSGWMVVKCCTPAKLLTVQRLWKNLANSSRLSYRTRPIGNKLNRCFDELTRVVSSNGYRYGYPLFFIFIFSLIETERRKRYELNRMKWACCKRAAANFSFFPLR